MASRKNNPANQQNRLFKQLTRVFSGPIIRYRSQTGRQIRRRDMDKYANRFKSASGQQFKKSEYHAYEKMQANAFVNQNRSERYADFDQMEYTPEIASALDIYADEMTTSSDLTPLLTIKCHSDEIKAILDTLYHSVLNIEFNLFGWCRSMCKFGDYFLYLDIDEDQGVRTAIGLPSMEVERLEGEDKTNPNYVQYQWNSAGMTFENWQIAHFRILGDDKYAPYGTSVLEASRRIWRQLVLLEDAMMAYRIVRAPERRVFYIDVGNINANDVEQYMQKVMTQMKRNQLVDADTGRVDLRYNPMSVEEDYFIPVRGGTSSKIENLPGGQWAGDIDDVKYLRDKLFSALKIPQSYLTQGDEGTEDKTTLAQKDIRFARTVQRLQRSVISELEKVGIIHLYTLGYRGDDIISFDLSLNNPSKLAELQELEHWKTKFDAASSATEGYFSRRWIAEHLFHLSEDEFLRNSREIVYDKKYDAFLQAQFEAATADAAGGLGGLDRGLGDDLGGDLGGGFGGEELGGELGGEELGPELGGEAPAGAEEEDVLLATPEAEVPGKRDATVPTTFTRADGKTTTKRSHGWYEPRKVDRRGSGARKRSYLSHITPEMFRNTDRTRHPGKEELDRLGKGIYENLDSTYDIEEKKLIKANLEIRRLVENLEQNEDANKDKT
tara:strand:+ start:1689 stop:3689 length:2001 start_codon:yes stop_codon:yes gene_type:complete